MFNLFVGVMSALRNLQDRLKQVEREKKEAEQHMKKLAASAASTAQSAGKSNDALPHQLPLTSIRQHLSCDNYLENYQSCSVPYCVAQLRIIMCTVI